MANPVQFKANNSLSSMYMHISMQVGSDGMFSPETATFSFKYRLDGKDVRFRINDEEDVLFPKRQTILSKIIATTYAPNIVKRLPANLVFDMQYKIVITNEKVIRCTLLSVVARKGKKSKTLERTHEIFRKIRKSVSLIPIAFADASCLSLSECNAEDRKLEIERKNEERLRLKREKEAEAERRKKEKAEAAALRKKEKAEAAALRKKEKEAKQNMLTESDKKRIKAVAL